MKKIRNKHIPPACLMYLKFSSMMVNVLIIFCHSFMVTSCKKFVEVEKPSNEVATVDVFANDHTAISALTGLYVQMSTVTLQFTNGGLSIFGSLSADDIYNTTVNKDYDPFVKNSIPSNEQTTNNSRIWSQAYALIYQANAILEGLNKSSDLTRSVKNQIVGETKCLRAFYYFYLINLYGNVPLVTTTDYRVNGIMARTATSQVYLQIINDLKEAQTLLPTSYPSPGKARINKWTATALLARTYLYTGDWVNAENEASSMIASSDYHIENNLSEVFKMNSTETIWEIIAPGDLNAQEGIAFIPYSPDTRPTFALTSYLLNAFPVNDWRKLNWITSNTTGSPAETFYYPFKYKAWDLPHTENSIIFRLAEQYLIRAEARAQLNRITEGKEDLNMIRTRAGLPNTIANTQSTLLTAIENERQLEFFTEWGHRWFDLKRTNRANAVLSVGKTSNWQSTDVLYPIPFSEIQINPSLSQNNGY